MPITLTDFHYIGIPALVLKISKQAVHIENPGTFKECIIVLRKMVKALPTLAKKPHHEIIDLVTQLMVSPILVVKAHSFLSFFF